MGAPKITSRTHPDLHVIKRHMKICAEELSNMKEKPLSINDIKFYFSSIIEEANILLREAIYEYNELDEDTLNAVEQADKARNAELYNSNPRGHQDLLHDFYKRQDEIFNELLEKYTAYYDEREEESDDECI